MLFIFLKKPIQIILILLILSALLYSCSSQTKTLHKSIEVTLIDQNTDNSIENAEVYFTKIIEARDILTETKNTDATGKCRFEFEFDLKVDYRVMAIKDGFFGYLSDDTVNILKSGMRITENSDDEITLYLTSDPNHQKDYWTGKLTRYVPDTLIEILKSNNYNGRIPLLFWEDISHLLKAGADTTVISNFPVNPVSSSITNESYLGVITQWLIESIRISEMNDIHDPFSKFPSLNPVLKTKGDQKLSKVDMMNEAYNFYLSWWEKVKNIDKKEGCKIDPLEGTGIKW